VLGEAEVMGVQMNLKDISNDNVIVSELIEKGGKQQTPFLVDSERNVQMYDSGDIIAYLEEHYKKASVTEFGNVCESCQ
tara:strand:+ start:1470 stop:1706 length:237 start_codon:yes stop_codon:yes gene_type:complete